VGVAHWGYRERFRAADLTASPFLAQELCAGGWSQLAGQVTMMPQAISDCITVQLFGELDLISAPRLERRLDQLRRDGARLITLDLSGVEFLAAAGLSVFIGADHAQQAAGGRLLLTRPTRMAGHVLAMTGLDTMVSLPCGQ
jgi:anti-anti-sigma factor